MSNSAHKTGAGSSGKISSISSPATESSGDGTSKCLDAFIIALSEANSDHGWFESTKNLQEVSLQFCMACRDRATLHVHIKAGTPRRLWTSTKEDSRSLGPTSGEQAQKRVPTLRARGITWELQISPQVLFESPELVRALERFVGGDAFNHDVRALSWSTRLAAVIFGRDFDQPVDGLNWPPSLRQLTFGRLFNQPVDNVVLPATLQQLTFGQCFNQKIDKVVWPESLLHLTFGAFFNQPINNVVWPGSLQRLTFKGNFNHAIDNVVWPASLEQLVFGCYFDQVIDNVVWPSSLQRLTFGACFDRPIDKAVWSVSLQILAFGFEFDQAIDKVVWPASLRCLTFGACFDQDLDNVVWPASLRHLSLGWSFNRPLRCMQKWPSTIIELTLLGYPSRAYAHSLVGVAWPAGLKKLTVGCRRGLEALTLPTGAEICSYGNYADCCEYSEEQYQCWYHNVLL